MAANASPACRLADVARAALAHERPLSVQKIYRVAEYPHVTGFTAQAVELEVDPETGQMTLLDVVTAHDVGTIINPLGHQGQIEGGLIQGIGFGMIEEMRAEEGRVSTLSLGDYKIPNIKDIPPLKTVLVQEAASVQCRSRENRSARVASHPLPRRSPMPYTMRWACASVICRSRQKRCTVRCRRSRGWRRDASSKTGGADDSHDSDAGQWQGLYGGRAVATLAHRLFTL